MITEDFTIDIHLNIVDSTARFNSQGDILNLAEIRANFTRKEQSYYQQVPSNMFYGDGEPVLILREDDSSERFDELFNEETIFTYKILFLTGALDHTTSPSDPLFNEMREFSQAFKKWRKVLKEHTGGNTEAKAL